MENERSQVFSLLVDNTPGVLSRIAGLFSRRSYNIDSITANPTADPRYSRITVVVPGDELILQQIENQLRKLQDVRNIKRLYPHDAVTRELMLVKVSVDAGSRQGLISLTEIYHGRVVDVDAHSMMISIVGAQSKIEAFLTLLEDYQILELARTGVTGLARGAESVEMLD